jgi:hypothetical protein
MRSAVDPSKIHRLLRELGRRARGPGRVYLTGGASALLEGWRASTVDIDVRFDPEPEGVFEAIAELKNELDVNVELASPDHFLPPLPEWRSHSTFIARHGDVEFYHYDFRAQALSKLARGHQRDLGDVRAMLGRGLVSKAELGEAFEAIKPQLIRYPALDPEAFERRVRSFLEEDDLEGDEDA